MSSSPKTDLRLDWCSHKAATWAVEHWHYSRSMPAGKAVTIGVWERSAFIGSVIFSRGASDAIGKPYRLDQTQIAELVRVALYRHLAPVSRVVSIAVRMIASQSPGLRLLVSYADPYEGHTGGIYQAMNWLYTGTTAKDYAIVEPNGRRWHSRMVASSGVKKCFGVYKRVIRPSDGVRIELPGKHKYLMPLDAAMRAQIAPLAKPYPKRDRSAENGTAGTPSRERCDSDSVAPLSADLTHGP